MKSKTSRRNGKGRVLRSAEQRRVLMEEYRASGLSKSEFSRQRGIKLATFCHWFDGERGRKGKLINKVSKPTVDFTEVKMSLPRSAPIEVDLPTGICIRVAEPGMLNGLVEFVRAVCAPECREASTC